MSDEIQSGAGGGSIQPKSNADLGGLLRSIDSDLAGLPPEQREKLRMDLAQGKINAANKAFEMGVDSEAMRRQLDVMSDKTKDVSNTPGASVTMSSTINSAVGRTEIIMGNTEEAAKGRLPRSLTGTRDFTLWYVIIGALALVMIVYAVTRH